MDDIKKKLAAIPEEAPDAEDLRMIKESSRINDGSAVSLNAFMDSLEGYGGKILLRIPKSLHKRLTEEARVEGISLNQYALYKLSR